MDLNIGRGLERGKMPGKHIIELVQLAKPISHRVTLDVPKARLVLSKRILDLVMSLTGLLCSAPLWGVIALAIMLEDRGPVFYSQKRTGSGGRPFRIFKFRSMVREAERETGPVWAAPNDGRVTRVGRLLRATAMDELPQLWNIFKGEMSFVGPRPERPELVTRFRREIKDYDRRFRVLPGLTGLAQIFGRYDSHPRHKLRYDLLYVRKQNFWLDIKVITLSLLISVRGNWEIRSRKIKWKPDDRDGVG